MPRSQEDFILKDETEDIAEHPAAAERPDQEDRRLFAVLLDHRQQIGRLLLRPPQSQQFPPLHPIVALPRRQGHHQSGAVVGRH